MAKLSEVTGSLRSMCENYSGEVDNRFCDLVVSLGYLRDAVDDARSRRSDLEDDDVLAIGWRVEHDLSQFVRLWYESYYCWT